MLAAPSGMRLRLLEPAVGVVSGGTRVVLHGVGFRPPPHSLMVRFRLALQAPEGESDSESTGAMDDKGGAATSALRSTPPPTVDVYAKFLLETQLECVVPSFERAAQRVIAARTSLAASSASVANAPHLVPLSVEVLMDGGNLRSNALVFRLHQPLEIRRVTPQSVLMASPPANVSVTLNILKLPGPMLSRRTSRNSSFAPREPVQVLEELAALPVYVRVRQTSERTGVTSEQTREANWKLSPLGAYEVEFEAVALSFGPASVDLTLNRTDFFRASNGAPAEARGYRVHRDVILRAVDPPCLSVTSGQMTDIRVLGDGFVDTGDLVVALSQREVTGETFGDDGEGGTAMKTATKETEIAQLNATFHSEHELRCTVQANMPFGRTTFRVSLNGGRQFGRSRVAALLYRDRELLEAVPSSASLSGGALIAIRLSCPAMEDVDSLRHLQKLEPPRRIRVRFQAASSILEDVKQPDARILAKVVIAEASPDTPGLLLCQTPNFLDDVKTLVSQGGVNAGKSDGNDHVRRFTISVALGGDSFQGALDFGFYLPPVIRSLMQHRGPLTGDTRVTLRMKYKVPPRLKLLVRFSSLSTVTTMIVNGNLVKPKQDDGQTTSEGLDIGGITPQVRDEDAEEDPAFLITCQSPEWPDSGDAPHLTIVQVSYDGGTTFLPAVDPPFPLPPSSALAKDLSYLCFLFYPTPVIRTAVPLSADILGGSYIRLLGQNIVDHGAPCSVVFESPTMSRKVSGFVEKGELRCCAPSFNVGPARVFVSFNDEQYVHCSLHDPESDAPLDFIFYSSPAITRISPLCACVGESSELRIFGNNLIETERIRVRVSFSASNGSGRRLVFKDVPGTATDGVIIASTPLFSEEFANQSAMVDVALNGTDFSGTSVPLRYFSRYTIDRVEPSLGAFEVPVALALYVTPSIVSDRVLLRVLLGSCDMDDISADGATQTRQTLFGPVEATCWSASCVEFTLPPLNCLLESLQTLTTAVVELSFDAVHFHNVGSLRDHYRVYNMPHLTSASPLFGAVDREAKIVAHGAFLRASDVVKLSLFLEPAVRHNEKTKAKGKTRRSTARATPVPVVEVVAEVNFKRQRLTWSCPSLVQLRASPERRLPPLVAAPPTSIGKTERRVSSDGGGTGMLLPERVTMQISVVDGQPMALPFVFRYYRAPTLVAMSPRMGYICSGSLVSFEFAEKIATPTVDFRFGDSKSTSGRIRDERFVECFSPELPAGTHRISVSFNEQHFEPVVIVGAEDFDGTGAENEPATFQAFPLPVFVLPPDDRERVYAFGPTSGGTLVAIKGVGFISNTNIYVRFSSNFDDAFSGEPEVVVGAKVVDNETIRCVSPPSRRLGRVALHVSYNLQQFSDSTCYFEYHAPTRYAARGTLCGPVSGQTPLNLFIADTTGLPSLTKLLHCAVRFESEKEQTPKHQVDVEAQFDPKTRILSCLAPEWPSNELVALRVSLARGDYEQFEDSHIKFLFYDPPEGMITIEPAAGPVSGGTEVMAWCGSIVETGDITVSIRLCDRDTSSPRKPVNARSSAGSGVPSTGSERKPAASTMVVKGEIVGEAVRFTTPRVDAACMALLSISLNGIDYTVAQKPLHFTYYVEPVLRRINPGWAAVEGVNDALVVEGEHIRDFGCKLLVRFSLQGSKRAAEDSRIVSARCLENSASSASGDGALQCVFPAAPPGFYEVEVSLNGQQFSKSLYVSAKFGNLSGTACTALLPFRHFSSPFCLATATGPAAGGSTVVLFLGGKLLKLLAKDVKCQVQFSPTRNADRSFRPSVGPPGSNNTTKTVANVPPDTISMPGEIDHATARVTCRAPLLRVACVSYVDILLPSGVTTTSSVCQLFGVRPQDREKYYSYESPSITEIAPSCGPNSGGTQLVIEGANILDTAQIFVRFRNSANEREFVLVPARYSRTFPGGAQSYAPLIICQTPPLEFVDKGPFTQADTTASSVSAAPSVSQPSTRIRDIAAAGKVRAQAFQLLAEQSLKAQHACSAALQNGGDAAGTTTLRISRAGTKGGRRSSVSSNIGAAEVGGATVLVDFTLNAGEQFIAHSVRFYYHQEVDPGDLKWSPRHMPMQSPGGRLAAETRVLKVVLPKHFRLTDAPERVCFRFDGVDALPLLSMRRGSRVMLHETDSRSQLVIPDALKLKAQSTMRRASTFFRNSTISGSSWNLLGPTVTGPTGPLPDATPRSSLPPTTSQTQQPSPSPYIAGKVVSANEVTCPVPSFPCPTTVQVFISLNAQQFVCIGDLSFHPAITIEDDDEETHQRFCSNIGGGRFMLRCSPSPVLKFLAPEDVTTVAQQRERFQNVGLRKVSMALTQLGAGALSHLPTSQSENPATLAECEDEGDGDAESNGTNLKAAEIEDDDVEENNDADARKEKEDNIDDREDDARNPLETWRDRTFYSAQVVLVPPNPRLLKRVQATVSHVDNGMEVCTSVPDDFGCCVFEMADWSDQVLLTAVLPSSSGYGSYSTVVDLRSIHDRGEGAKDAGSTRTHLVVPQLPGVSKVNVVAFRPCGTQVKTCILTCDGKEVASEIMGSQRALDSHDASAIGIDLGVLAAAGCERCYVCVDFSLLEAAPSNNGEALAQTGIQVLVASSCGVQVCLSGTLVESSDLWVVAQIRVSLRENEVNSGVLERVADIEPVDRLVRSIQDLAAPSESYPEDNSLAQLSMKRDDGRGSPQPYTVPLTFEFTSADPSYSFSASARAKLVLSSHERRSILLPSSPLFTHMNSALSVNLECAMPPLTFSGPAMLVVSVGGVVFSNTVTVHCYDPRTWSVVALRPPCGQLPSSPLQHKPNHPVKLRIKGEHFVENHKIIVRMSGPSRYFAVRGAIEQVYVLSFRVSAIKNLRALLQPLGIGPQPTSMPSSSGNSTSLPPKREEDKVSSNAAGGPSGAPPTSWSTFTFTLRIECGDQSVFASCRETSVLAAISSASVLSWEELFEMHVAADRHAPLLLTMEIAEASMLKPLEIAQAQVCLDELQEGAPSMRRQRVRFAEHFKRGAFMGSVGSHAGSVPSEVELLLQLSPLTQDPEHLICEIPAPLLKHLPPQSLDVQVSSGDGHYSTPHRFLLYGAPKVTQTSPNVLPRSAGGEVIVTGSGFVDCGSVCIQLFACKANRFENCDEEQSALMAINSVGRLHRSSRADAETKTYFTRDVEGTFVSATALKFTVPAYLASYNIYYRVSFDDGRAFTEASSATNVLLFSTSAVSPRGGPVSGNTYATLHGTNIDACISSRRNVSPLVRISWKRGSRELEHVVVPGECYPREDAVYFYSPQSKFGLQNIAVVVEVAMVCKNAVQGFGVDNAPRFGCDEVTFVMYKTPTIKSVTPLTALVCGISVNEILVQGFDEKAASSMKLAPKLRFKRRGQMQVADAQLVSEARFECVVPRFNITNAVVTELPSTALAGVTSPSKARGVASNANMGLTGSNLRRLNGPAKLWTRTSGVFVALLGARNLRASKKNACNPFAVINVDKAQLKSTRKDGVFSPVWNEIFDFEWPGDKASVLPLVRVVLENQLTADQSESLGRVELTFPDIEPPAQPFALRAWFPLRRIRGKYAREDPDDAIAAASHPYQRSKSINKPAQIAVCGPTLGEVELAVAFVPPVTTSRKPPSALRISIMSAISVHPPPSLPQQLKSARDDGHSTCTSKKEKLLRAFRQRAAPVSLVPTELVVELALNGQDFWSTAPSKCYSVPVPIVLDAEPTFVCITGGTLLHLSGLNFVNSGCIRVAFAVLPEGSNAETSVGESTIVVEAKYRSSTSIVCLTPPLVDLATEASRVNIYLSLNGLDFDSILFPKQFTKVAELSAPASSVTTTLPLLPDDCVVEEDGDEHEDDQPDTTNHPQISIDTARDNAITLSNDQYVVNYRKIAALLPEAALVRDTLGLSPGRQGEHKRPEKFLLVPQLRVHLAPKIVRVRPTDGVYTSHLTVDGTNFTDTKVAVARFISTSADRDTRLAKLTVVSSTRMECSVPDFPRGVLVRIAIAMNGVEFVSCPGELRVFQSPRLTEVHPNWVAASTTLELELRGINLAAAADVVSRNEDDSNSSDDDAPDAAPVQVSFASNQGRRVVRGMCEDGRVRCTIPQDILQSCKPGGRRKRTTPMRDLAAVPIMVDIWLGGTHKAFTGTPLPLHVYREVPTVTTVAPMDGPVYGGFAIVVEGRGFIDTGKIIVRFQLYVEQQLTKTRAREASAIHNGVIRAQSPGKRQSRNDGIAKESDTEVSPAQADGDYYVDAPAKFVSSERVLCSAPSFPREGVYTVLVALNGVEFSCINDASWFLAWQNWQKRKRLLSHTLFSRTTTPQKAVVASAGGETSPAATSVSEQARVSTTLDECDIERLRRKSSFMLPQITGAMQTKSSAEAFKSPRNVLGFDPLAEEPGELEEGDPAAQRLLHWYPSPAEEDRVSGKPLLALLEHLCTSPDSQRLICRRLRIVFRLRGAVFVTQQVNDGGSASVALPFPAFVDALRLIFPNALMVDVEDIWNAVKQRPPDTITLKQLLKRLMRNTSRMQRSASPEPGPTHYDPRFDVTTPRETAALILPPVERQERTPNPPSELFMDYNAAMEAVKPCPPRPVFRKRKFNTSWCNPAIASPASNEMPPQTPHPPPGSQPPTNRSSHHPRVTSGTVISTTLDGIAGVKANRTGDDSEKATDATAQPAASRNAGTLKAETRAKEDGIRAPRSLPAPAVSVTSGRHASTVAGSTAAPAVMPRAPNLGGPNLFYNDIAPLYAKFLNSAEVQKFMKQ